jgi:hypothetical protein
LKVAFIQDEYRTVDATVERLGEMKFDVLFTCVPETEIEKVYPSEKLPALRKISTLTGFVPAELAKRKVPPVALRETDIGYRARVVPFWLGKLGAEKWQIAPRFEQHCAGSGLKLDVKYREEERLYGEKWIEFLLRCKALLGVESGASVFDFTGLIQRQVDEHIFSHPDATFEEVHQRFLARHEGKIHLNQISPRAFEAAALRTAMVLYEGEYSGVLKADLHYIPLKKDFSNVREVVRRLKDVSSLEQMVERTYREIALNPLYSYERFVQEVDEVLEEEVTARNTAQPSRATSTALASLRPAFDHFWVIARTNCIPVRLRVQIFFSWVFWRSMRYVVVPLWEWIPAGGKTFLRPVVRRVFRLKR